jgi:hypothetical protein
MASHLYSTTAETRGLRHRGFLVYTPDLPERPLLHPQLRKKGRKRKTQKPEDCLEFILLNKNVTFVKKNKTKSKILKHNTLVSQ